MDLLAIDIDANRNTEFARYKACRAVLDVYPDYYRRVGFDPPWIGYFVRRGNELVGSGGFKGKPRDGRVEIAYGTFKGFERQGVGTEICRALVSLSLKTDPLVRVTARTLPENHASAGILRKNGFVFAGVVWDEDDGNVWEWEYRGQPPSESGVA